MVDHDMVVRFDLFEAYDVLRLRAWSGHLDRVPREELELLLLAVERLLVEAAAGDLDREQMAAALGVDPIARDGDWLLIDSCWVQLGDVQRLLDDALAPLPAQVFAADGALVAYLSADAGTTSGRETGVASAREAGVVSAREVGASAGEAGVASAREAHLMCMRGLARHPTAMTPRYYVLCAGTPRDMGDIEAWRGLPVLDEGSGRPAEGSGRAAEGSVRAAEDAG
jgi:hypothetical protein